MEKLFFLGVSEGKKMPEAEVIELINNEICSVGVCPAKVLFGKAVHPNAPVGGEVGAIVAVSEPELAFHTAFHLKTRLRHGTYQLMLDESSLPNVSFQAIVDYNPVIKLDMIVSEWQRIAVRLFEKERIFVSAFFYQDQNKNIYICGNANTIMVGNVNKWKAVLREAIRQMNYDHDIFVINPSFIEIKEIV